MRENEVYGGWPLGFGRWSQDGQIIESIWEQKPTQKRARPAERNFRLIRNETTTFVSRQEQMTLDFWVQKIIHSPFVPKMLGTENRGAMKVIHESLGNILKPKPISFPLSLSYKNIDKKGKKERSKMNICRA